MKKRSLLIVFTFIICSLHLSASAQRSEQKIPLKPGWNAVFFEVEPEIRDCDVVFQGIPVQSVWTWNRRFNSVQFIQDPATLVPEQPEWLTYFPPSSPLAPSTELFIVRGGRPYLIKLGGQAEVELLVKGRPTTRRIDWMADSPNLVGFYVDGVTPPTFSDYFAPSTAHESQRFFRLGADGKWAKVSAPASERLRAGEAYWIWSEGSSQYQGPLSLTFDVGDGLDYARISLEQRLKIRNHSSEPCEVTLALRPSLESASDSAPALAGDVPLSWYESDLANGVIGWKPLSGPLTLTVPAGGESQVRLAVRRRDMAAFTPPAGREALYQSLLELKSDIGSTFLLPVSAKGVLEPRSPYSARASRSAARGAAAAPLVVAPGLWVGEATINAVSNPTDGSLDPSKPLPVASPASLRLIVHQDESGKSRFLQQVLQMWKEGAWIPNPDDATSETFVLDEDNPGRGVLLTDDALIPQFSGVALRDVKMVGRRMSSAVFGFKEPIEATGVLGASGTVLQATIILDYQDPVNPFKSKYHPDHDNWDARYENVLPEGKESFTVTREISLEFTEEDPEDLRFSGQGDESLWGIYRETIQGIHRSAIHVEGTFRLRHVSDIGVLNDGLK